MPEPKGSLPSPQKECQKAMLKRSLRLSVGRDAEAGWWPRCSWAQKWYRVFFAEFMALASPAFGIHRLCS